MQKKNKSKKLNAILKLKSTKLKKKTFDSTPVYLYQPVDGEVVHWVASPTQTFLGVHHMFLPHERSWGRNA